MKRMNNQLSLCRYSTRHCYCHALLDSKLKLKLLSCPSSMNVTMNLLWFWGNELASPTSTWNRHIAFVIWITKLKYVEMLIMGVRNAILICSFSLLWKESCHELSMRSTRNPNGFYCEFWKFIILKINTRQS